MHDISVYKRAKLFLSIPKPEFHVWLEEAVVILQRLLTVGCSSSFSLNLNSNLAAPQPTKNKFCILQLDYAADVTLCKDTCREWKITPHNHDVHLGLVCFSKQCCFDNREETPVNGWDSLEWNDGGVSTQPRWKKSQREALLQATQTKQNNFLSSVQSVDLW